MTTLVFLHIPKTAGQSVHAELARVVGAAAVSPVRVHTQAGPDAQFPPGYALYSGHLDWTGLDAVTGDRFVFTVLRDPRERIASFYLYLLAKAEKTEAEALALPGNRGLKVIRSVSADDYFFGGDQAWKVFVRDHYDNFYCSYFATRKVRGWRDIAKLPKPEMMARARAGAAALDQIYTTGDLGALEADVLRLTGQPVQLAGRFVNAGPDPTAPTRWAELLGRLERDDTAARLERFAAFDSLLLRELGLTAD